jgi:hypothetical protein
MDVPTLELLSRHLLGERLRMRATESAGGPAVFALLREINRIPATAGLPTQDLITGNRIANMGGSLALAICLAATGDRHGWEGEEPPDGWAPDFLARCARLAEAEVVHGHCESGFMRLVEHGPNEFHAWIASKRQPAIWRERLDWDWWAARSRDQLGPVSDQASPLARVTAMAYQLGYPADAEIVGTTVADFTGVLERLITWAQQEHDRGIEPQPQAELHLAERLAAELGGDAIELVDVLAAFTLDRANAIYHAAVPGIAAAPLVRVGPDQVVWSLHGLLTEPLLFLARELKRRNPEAYHNAAIQREAVFREEIYALFADKRFVTAPRRIALRGDKGDLRTDIDALVFDRKTGTLGLFELKSQDPFVRSVAELTRQRDNVLYANRQVSGVLAWIKRHGADELVARVDTRTAKTFKAHRVFPFVLGRYLVHFNDGAEPDKRAAWGTWPQVLRLLERQPIRATDANPIASLFARLTKDTPLTRTITGDGSRSIEVGSLRLVVHPSYEAYQDWSAIVG